MSAPAVFACGCCEGGCLCWHHQPVPYSAPVALCRYHLSNGPVPDGAETCECGAPVSRKDGHPYPVGGGWGLACEDCRAESEQAINNGDDANGATPEQWDEWARAARGPQPEVKS